MKFSYSWLAAYAELPPLAAAAGAEEHLRVAEQLATELTSVGLSIEGIELVAGDPVLDVEVTSNRPDCMNHVGLAREIAVHEVPGNHDTMLTEPNVTALAQQLNQCLLRTQAENQSK